MLDGNTGSGIEDVAAAHVGNPGKQTWRDLHAHLCALANRRAELDVEEAAALLRGQRLSIHRKLGMGSFREYMERFFGYGPRAAQDRLRVAETLELFPHLRAAFARGELKHSAVRELARVIVPDTEQEWLSATRGKGLREIEQLVSGRKRGDRPEDRPDPASARKVLRFEVSPATYALFRELQRDVADEVGHGLDDDATVAILCRRALEPAPAADGPTRAPHQVAVTICEGCQRGWQDGAGQLVEIPAAAIAVAECDAQRIGRLDAASPERAVQDIPPATRRLVWRRDHGRCVVPSCRATRGLDLHHIVPRAAGGSHEPANLCLLCSGHHRALHADGSLSITGTAPALEIRTLDRPAALPAPASPPRLALPPPTPHDDAVRSALIGLGYRGHEARLAVDRARAHVGRDPTLDELLKAALQRSPKPRPG